MVVWRKPMKIAVAQADLETIYGSSDRLSARNQQTASSQGSYNSIQTILRLLSCVLLASLAIAFALHHHYSL